MRIWTLLSILAVCVLLSMRSEYALADIGDPSWPIGDGLYLGGDPGMLSGLPEGTLGKDSRMPSPADPTAGNGLAASSLAVTALGSLGGTTSHAQGINGHGQVVGSSQVSTGEQHAFLWERGVMRDLGIPGIATDINDRGQVVGNRQEGTQPPRAFLWQNGVLTELGFLDGDDASEAHHINERGQILGQSWLYGTNGRRAFIWQAGVMTPLGNLPGYASCYASDINERGQAVGDCYNGQGDDMRPFLWQDGIMQQLGAFDARTFAGAINERGQIVGTCEMSTGSRAFLWQHGIVTFLGTLGGRGSSATDINERGQVVGFSTTVSGDRHPFIWQRGSMVDLGTLPGLTSYLAWDINEAGQVVGYGRPTPSSSSFTGFLWQDGLMLEVGPGIVREINNRGEGWLNHGGHAYMMSSSPASPSAGMRTAARAERTAALLSPHLQAAPNPFRADVALELALPTAAEVEASVYDISGRLVRRLQRGPLRAGPQRLSWDGRDDGGRDVGAGVFLVRAQTAVWSLSTKVIRAR